MKVAFTICSANYLAQAKTLGDSLLDHNPGYKFVIGLVDKLGPDMDLSLFDKFEILEVSSIAIPEFNRMRQRYNLIELNTSVKPFYFDFFLKRDENVESVVYFDPDILIYDKLTDLEKALENNNIVLTPHLLTAPPGSFPAKERHILKAGIYNLGFIAAARSPETSKFLAWWMDRLSKGCMVDSLGGMFVDQLWINLAPIYFKGVYILAHPGYNIAYWNLHERRISNKDGRYSVNGSFPLVFFHFSGFSPKRPGIVSKHDDSCSFEGREDIVPLFKGYGELLAANRYDLFADRPFFYADKRAAKRMMNALFSFKFLLPPRLRSFLMSLIKRAITFLKRNI